MKKEHTQAPCSEAPLPKLKTRQVSFLQSQDVETELRNPFQTDV